MNDPKDPFSLKGAKRKGNGEYQSKQAWYALMAPPKRSREAKHDSLFTVPERLLKHSKSIKPAKPVVTKADKMRKSYTSMRKEREDFRKRLVSLIMAEDEEGEGEDPNQFPNSREKETMRYYYYIQHGFDTIHVAPMDKRTYDMYVDNINQFVLFLLKQI